MGKYAFMLILLAIPKYQIFFETGSIYQILFVFTFLFSIYSMYKVIYAYRPKVYSHIEKYTVKILLIPISLLVGKFSLSCKHVIATFSCLCFFLEFFKNCILQNFFMQREAKCKDILFPLLFTLKIEYQTHFLHLIFFYLIGDIFISKYRSSSL